MDIVCSTYPDRKIYTLGGILHREDGPAIEHVSSGVEYWQHGYRHREDGPAVEWSNGEKYWYLCGKLHRIDGPAITWNDGYREWWINGKRCDAENVNRWLEEMGITDTNFTPEQSSLFVLYFGESLND